MAMDELTLERAARAAYERGRLRAALPALAAIVVLVAISFSGCGAPSFTIADGAVLAALATLLVHRGGRAAGGVKPGLVAGAVPFIAPLAVHAITHDCGPIAAAVCAAAGLCSGIALGATLARRNAALSSIATASVIAALTGALGCILIGTVALAGMTTGLALGAGPVIVFRRARA